MFSKVIALFSLAIVAAATFTTTVTDTAGPAATTLAQCTVAGGPQCCNSVLAASNSVANSVLLSLGVDVQDPLLLVGLTCSAINVAAPNCAQIPVCCDHNDWNGIVSVGCTSITL